jgi:hypothetical protein
MQPTPDRGISEAPEREREGWLAWWRAQGATSQALIPGLYAWAVTVEPVAWFREATLGPRLAAVLAVASLCLGPLLERTSPDRVRMASGWGTVMFSIGVWVLAPQGAFAGFDTPHGMAGMVGWALYAFASASPAREAAAGSATIGPTLRPRARASGIDAAILVLGLVLAVTLQAAGWKVLDRDRALLLRMATLAGALGLVTATSAAAISRGAPLEEDRVPRPRRQRLRTRTVVWCSLAVALLGFGAIYETAFRN